jgi:hypothetical protein
MTTDSKRLSFSLSPAGEMVLYAVGVSVLMGAWGIVMAVSMVTSGH